MVDIKCGLLLCPKTASSSEIRRNIKEVESSDPAKHGWSLIIASECKGNQFRHCLERFLCNTYGTRCPMEDEHELFYWDNYLWAGVDHFNMTPYYSLDGDIMMVESIFNNGSEDCHFKVWAKNIMSGKSFDMLDTFFVASKNTGVYSEGVILRQSTRENILGKDHRFNGYINHGVVDEASLLQGLLAGYSAAGGLGEHHVVCMNAPVTEDIDVAKCYMSGLVHINRYNNTAREYCGDAGYVLVLMKYATLGMENWHRNHKINKCFGCNSSFVGSNAGVIDKYKGFMCNDCTWQDYYEMGFSIIESDYAKTLFSRMRNRRVTLRGAPHLKTVVYNDRRMDSVEVTSDEYNEQMFDDKRVYAACPILSDDCRIIMSNMYSDSFRLDVLVKGETLESDGRITICTAGELKRVFLHIKDGSQYRFYGQMSMQVLFDIIPLQVANKKRIINIPIVFAISTESMNVAREDSVIKINIKKNRDAVNKIKWAYAKHLLVGR